jgi:hypothetical protein
LTIEYFPTLQAGTDWAGTGGTYEFYNVDVVYDYLVSPARGRRGHSGRR